MNIPMMKKTNGAYKALVNFGMITLELKHNQSKTTFTNIKNDTTNDQVAIAQTSALHNLIIDHGVFDFDKK